MGDGNSMSRNEGSAIDRGPASAILMAVTVAVENNVRGLDDLNVRIGSVSDCGWSICFFPNWLRAGDFPRVPFVAL